jgi:polynucleotide 5'-kinase involved in rRNA processing
MASARRSELAEVTEVDSLAPTDQPKLVVMHGRGGSGKSTLVRVIVERATEAGRNVSTTLIHRVRHFRLGTAGLGSVS